MEDFSFINQVMFHFDFDQYQIELSLILVKIKMKSLRWKKNRHAFDHKRQGWQFWDLKKNVLWHSTSLLPLRAPFYVFSKRHYCSYGKELFAPRESFNPAHFDVYEAVNQWLERSGWSLAANRGGRRSFAAKTCSVAGAQWVRWVFVFYPATVCCCFK